MLIEDVVREEVVNKGYFDADFYTESDDAFAIQALSLERHFVKAGWIEGRLPSRDYDISHLCAQALGIVPSLQNGKVAWATIDSVLRAENKRSGELYSLLRELFNLEKLALKIAEYGIEPEFINLSRAALFADYLGLMKLDDIFRQPPDPAIVFYLLERLEEDFLSSVLPASCLNAILNLSIGESLSETSSENLCIDEHVLYILEGAVDAQYYARTYGLESIKSRRACALHYYENGVKKSLNPSEGFDTRFYLKSNPDVAGAGVNPYYHFLVAGQKEGRLPRRPGGIMRTQIEQVFQELYLPNGSDMSPEVGSDFVVERCESLLFGRGQILISLSQDVYTQNTGGIQIFLADEQNKASRQGYIYIHLCPARPSLRVQQNQADISVTITIDAETIGSMSLPDLLRLVKGRSSAADRVLVVHSILGWSTHAIERLAREFSPIETYFWIHDYSLTCEGYTLLRNRVSFCNAPDISSTSCLVCAYGETRERHLAAVRKLIQLTGATMLAPSEAAAAIWKFSNTYNSAPILVIPHLEIVRLDSKRSQKPLVGSAGWPLRVAFMGHPVFHKGWHVFEAICKQTEHKPSFDLFHFAKTEGFYSSKRVRYRVLDVSLSARWQAREALLAEDIDVVVIPSIWPETFSYVTYEALSAGCIVLTTAESGNVARAVEKSGQGVVHRSERHLVESFENGSLVERVRDSRQAGVHLCELIRTGTTCANLSAKRTLA